MYKYIRQTVGLFLSLTNQFFNLGTCIPFVHLVVLFLFSAVPNLLLPLIHFLDFLPTGPRGLAPSVLDAGPQVLVHAG